LRCSHFIVNKPQFFQRIVTEILEGTHSSAVVAGFVFSLMSYVVDLISELLSLARGWATSCPLTVWWIASLC
jgi:hypothetical protein